MCEDSEAITDRASTAMLLTPRVAFDAVVAAVAAEEEEEEEQLERRRAAGRTPDLTSRLAMFSLWSPGRTAEEEAREREREIKRREREKEKE